MTMEPEEKPTTRNGEYIEALKVARTQSAVSAKHVAALFGVSLVTVNRWVKKRPEFRAYRSPAGQRAPWAFPVDALEEVLGFSLRDTKEGNR